MRREKSSESSDHERKSEVIKLDAIKFATKRGRGWIDVGGSRMFLLDISGGWHNFVERIGLFAGSETSRRVLFEAGQAETFTTKALNAGVLEQTPQGFRDALETLSEAGFGDFRVKDLRFDEPYARIVCPDTYEGWAYLQGEKKSDVPVCHFSSGALLSFMQHTSGQTDLISTETRCIARGDLECEFVVGRPDVLAQQGITRPRYGMTIKERADFLENLLIEKEKAGREIRRKNAELSALNKIVTAVSQSLDLKEISRLAIQELRGIVGDKAVMIYLLDPVHRELTVAAQEGFSEEFVREVSRLKLGEGLSGSVAHVGLPSVYDDYSDYPGALEAACKMEKIRSLLAVPLKAKNQTVGVLTVASKTPHHFTEAEIKLLTMIGNQLGVVTEKGRLHAELKESERKYKTLVEDINEGYFVFQENRIVFANQTFLRMHGYDSEEAMDRDYREFIAPESLTEVQEMVFGKMSGRPHVENLEFLRCHKDGQKLPTELKIGLSEFEGQPAIIGISRDISERKKLEQKLLENERLASIGELTSALAHEIRNPLSSIKMTLQILSKNLQVQGFDKKRFEIALTEIKRLDSFLQDMLQLARPIKMTRTMNALSDIVTECLDLLSDKAGSRGIWIHFGGPPDDGKIPVDFSKMEEVFLNLFLNAMDALPHGGEIQVDIRRVDSDSGPVMEVEIKDSGTGISFEHLSHIFDPFFSTKAKGAGLGLANVKRIVEAHHGTIDVKSKVGFGASFRIRLPLE